MAESQEEPKPEATTPVPAPTPAAVPKPAPKPVAAEPLLVIETLVEIRSVVINEQAYELRHPAKLSIFESDRVRRRAERLQALMNVASADVELSTEEEAEVSALLDYIAKFVMPAPAEVHAVLNDQDRLAIVQAFSRLRRVKAPLDESKPATASPTGEN